MENPENNISRLFGVLVEKRGNEVKQFVLQVYSETRKPSLLHHHIVQLFKRDQTLRIVTTNYDTLITTAAKEFRGAKPNEYVYPHLSLDVENPPQTVVLTENEDAISSPKLDFQIDGIAYIHGSVNSDPSQIVLTDKDFNRAYVGREKKAFDFLSGVLDDRYVLFLGYSANDPIVGQVIEAWCNMEKTFVFTHEDYGQSWHDMGVDVRSYSSPELGEKHDALINTLKGWKLDVQRHKKVSAVSGELPGPPLPQSSEGSLTDSSEE